MNTARLVDGMTMAKPMRSSIIPHVVYGMKTFGNYHPSEDEYARYIRLRNERYAAEDALYTKRMRWARIALGALLLLAFLI